MLSDSESDVSDIRLTINEHYAKAYAYKKEREELGRLKEKYGSEVDEEDLDEDESEDESEDEDGEELTPAVDAAILRTLAKIKRKDPEIYDKDKSIYEEERTRSGQSKYRSKPATSGNIKPLTIKQHALSSMLSSGFHSPSPEPRIVTHDEEQNALRSEAISAFHQALDIDVEGEDGDGFLVPREKTKDEVEREEEEYKAFLEREVGEDISCLVTVEDEFSALREMENTEGEGESENKEITPKGKKKRKKRKEEEKLREQTDQEFLMNYILNRGWIDLSSKRLPTYKEITGDVRGNASQSQNVQDGTGEHCSAELSEDDEFEEIAERFESSYNFRFEEPGAAIIQTHPRNIDSAVRHPDMSRKKTRERRKQRKEEELLKKREEVKRLKALKIKELRQKIEKIGCEGGIDIDSPALAQFDLDGDWDPGKHDSQMAELYDEAREEDVEKPQWDYDIDIGDVGSVTTGPRKAKIRKTKQTKHKDDEAANDGVDVDAMDADVPVEQNEEEWDGTEEMRKRKLLEYVDEVYKIDFNDMESVGGIPTRFKYTSVTPHNYALTPSETLLATDAELNEYMGIKKFAPYKKDNAWDAKRANRLKELKAKLKERRWVHGGAYDEGEENQRTRKRKGKRERQRAKAGGNSDGESQNVEEHTQPSRKREREDEQE